MSLVGTINGSAVLDIQEGEIGSSFVSSFTFCISSFLLPLFRLSLQLKHLHWRDVIVEFQFCFALATCCDSVLVCRGSNASLFCFISLGWILLWDLVWMCTHPGLYWFSFGCGSHLRFRLRKVP